MDDSRIVLTRDPYRIVAVTSDGEDDRIIGYAVLNVADARLHCGLTLDDAKARVDDFIRDEDRKRGPASLSKNSKPLRR